VSAKAREAGAQLALDSEVDGENTGVAQLRAQLDTAEWELAPTTVRAPANGFVSNLSLATGDRATPFKAAMSFVRLDEITLLALFPQNGMQTVREHVPVKLAFASVPGRSCLSSSRLGSRSSISFGPSRRTAKWRWVTWGSHRNAVLDARVRALFRKRCFQATALSGGVM
jgi:hypothetical protein